MDSTTLTTTEAWADLKKTAEEMRLVRNARSRLSGRDPIAKRNIAQLSVKLRELTARHESLREILIARGEINA